MMKFKQKNPDCPPCNKIKCFACENGACIVLVDNDFGERDCPFFKTSEQFEREKKAAEEKSSKARRR